jgi:hypothetical protein
MRCEGKQLGLLSFSAFGSFALSLQPWSLGASGRFLAARLGSILLVDSPDATTTKRMSVPKLAPLTPFNTDLNIRIRLPGFSSHFSSIASIDRIYVHRPSTALLHIFSSHSRYE